MKILLSAIILLTSILTFAQNEQKYKVAIIHINDVHANIDLFPKLAAYITDCKENYDTVLVVSSGDLFSGNPIVDQYKFRGFPIIDLMNKCGFIANGIGNHEFDYGQENLNKLAENANFKFLIANMETKNAIFKNYDSKLEITLANNYKILLSSLLDIEKDKKPETHPSNIEEINFLKEKKSLKTFIKNEKTNQFFILLSHMGIDKDTVLVEKVDGVDIVLGGHTHTIIEHPKLYNKTLVAQAGGYLKFIGKISLEFENDKLLKTYAELIATDTLEKSDLKIQKIVDKYNNNKTLQTAIGNLSDSISGNDELGSLMTDALTSELDCDIAFQNNGGIRTSRLEKGNITRKDIYTLDPFGNTLAIFEMTTKQINAFIKSTYEEKNNELLQVSGIKYTVSVDTNNKIQNIDIKDYSNKDLDNSRTYKVAVNTYIAKKYSIKYKKQISETKERAVELLQKFIKRNVDLNYHGVKRAKLEVE